MRMFRFESTPTSNPPTVSSRPPRSPDDEDGFDCTMTFTCASPLPERISWRRSGEILVVERVAARVRVLVDMNSAEHSDARTAAVTRRLRTWGRDIRFSRGKRLKKHRSRNAGAVLVLAPCQMRRFGTFVRKNADRSFGPPTAK